MVRVVYLRYFGHRGEPHVDGPCDANVVFDDAEPVESVRDFVDLVDECKRRLTAAGSVFDAATVVVCNVMDFHGD